MFELKIIQKDKLFVLETPKEKEVVKFSSQTLAVEEQGKWKCTDPDTDQWVKKISDKVFEVFENEDVQYIDLTRYSEEELWNDYVSSYHSSMAELRELYGEDSNQIIAECIAEIDG